MLRPASRAAGSSGVVSLVRLAVTLAVLIAVGWPARPGGRDGFPLSNYPMFGYLRPPRSVVHTVLGVDAAGRRRPLTPWHVGGTSHSKHALETVLHAVQGGTGSVLCRAVAGRVAASPLASSPVALEVVTDTWDSLDALRPDATPLHRRVHARCDVP